MLDKRKHLEESPIAPVIDMRWNNVKPWDRHGLILIVAGLGYIMIGFNYVMSPTSRMSEITINIFPGNTVYLGYIIVGLTAIISARWPNRPRTLGYTALTGWTVAIAGIYFYGGVELESSALMGSGLIWSITGFLWWAISGLISPPSERASSGVPSPHRDHSGGFDRYASGDSHSALGDQGYAHIRHGVEPLGDGERGLRAS